LKAIQGRKPSHLASNSTFPRTKEPVCIKWMWPIFTNSRSEGSCLFNWPFISPPLKSCLLWWRDLGVTFKDTFSPLHSLYIFQFSVLYGCGMYILTPRPDLQTWGEFITWDLLRNIGLQGILGVISIFKIIYSFIVLKACFLDLSF
jgi:hypothetical protein